MTDYLSQQKQRKTTQQWIDHIANSELPAITSTVVMLDKFSNDDKSSLPKLSEAILHDQGLSSCLLKVANNTHHFGVNKVTTVSRAAVVLGISAVKNICLTAKLVESLLQNKNLDINVYNRLTQLMANSFYSGMLAKMMTPQYNDDTQEEVYLAAMLYRIGETAFWSTGGEAVQQLIQHTNMQDKDFAEFCKQEIGCNFNELSRGLASTWNLSDILLKALDDPTTRTDEVKIIYFADQLSSAIASPKSSFEQFNKLLENIAAIMKINVRQLKVRIEQTRELSQQLLASYGADKLQELIKPLPSAGEFGKPVLPKIEQASKEKIVLEMFMNLTQLTTHSKNLNEYIQTVIQGSVLAFGFERCSFLMLTDDKSTVKLRFSHDIHGNSEPSNIAINLTRSNNVMEKSLKHKLPLLINNYQDKQWHDLITRELSEFINEGALAIAPVKISDKAIGVICAQTFQDKRKIPDDDFQQLCSLTEHLNMCLTMIMIR
ncbi:HDOD domain-containing protein [Thalassotalea fusca]